MTKPVLLDLFCRKGGAGYGYLLAGFDIVGVDIEDHSNGYPGEFHQADAIDFVRKHGHEFDAIHASPPCQDNIAIVASLRRRPGWTDNHVNLIPEVRKALKEFDVPTVIENGVTRRLRPDVVLCGLTFGLRVFRHRYFEVDNCTVPQPVHRSHQGHRVAGWRHSRYYDGDMVAVYGNGGGKGTVSAWQLAMGIDWMWNRKDLAEAIPPAYTEYVGRHINARESLSEEEAA